MATKKAQSETPEEDRGPWWVEDSNGAKFATYLKADGLKDTGESPFARDGYTLRSPLPAGATDPAEAVQEGESQ